MMYCNEMKEEVMESPSIDLWLAMLLADASFPSGTLGHSQGVEACYHYQLIDKKSPTESFRQFLQLSLRQMRHFLIPFVKAGYNIAKDETDDFSKCEKLVRLEALFHSMQINEVANRASIHQGKGFMRVATSSLLSSLPILDILQSFQTPPLKYQGHYAPTFGFLCPFLGISKDVSIRIFLRIQLRDLCIAAARLNIIGPMESTFFQFQFISSLEELLLQTNPIQSTSDASLDPYYQTIGFDEGDYPYQTCFFIDYFQSLHDRLYSRLFNS